MQHSTASQSSKSIGQKGGASMAHSEHGGDDNENPFILPSDEMIFTFKETEKDKKIIEREKNKQLRIWEKNRPIREGCLRRLGETDIEPTQLAINPKVQSKVNMAEAGGFTIPIERPKNRENRWQLIEKKREIGLVQQMLEVKQTEIERLAEMATMREDGLTCSENMLETDTHLFINFFNRIKQQTQDAQKVLDDTRRTKNDKVNEYKQMTESIQILQSNVSKNIEYLEDYKKYKDFLDNLYMSINSKEEQERIRQRKERKKVRFQVKMRQRQEEERLIYESLKAQGIDEPPQSLEQELQIDEQIQEIYEDSDSDSPERFNDTTELMHILQALEDQNLMQIQRMQTSEEHLEARKQDKVKQDRSYLKLQAELNHNKQNNDNRIENSSKELYALQNMQQDTANDTLPPDIQGNLEELCSVLFNQSKVDPPRQNDKKINAIAMLSEVEEMINEHLDFFGKEERRDQTNFRVIKYKIFDRAKKAANLAKEQEEARKMRQKQEDQALKDKYPRQKLFGKKQMVRSQMPKMKSVAKKKQKYTDEELDMIEYGLLELVELDQAQQKLQVEDL